MRTIPQGRGFSRFPASMKLGAAAAVLATISLWLALYYLLPPVPEMADLAARLGFAVKCSCVAALFCLLAGTEAVSHERLQTDAFDPLLGHETRRLKINQRYLQNTLEQTVLFVPGLFGLALYAADGRTMRAIAATTIVWILARWIFWIGYHKGAQYRVFGLTGSAQSMIVLLYVVGRFGYELAGIAGAVLPIVIFGLIEIVLVRSTRESAR